MTCRPGHPRLDRFGRVSYLRWEDTDNGNAVSDGFKYGYDRNSNRLYRTNEVNGAFGELYTAGGASAGYDDLNRLVAFARGALSDANSDGKPDTVATPAATQSWALDALGNWSSTTAGSTTTDRTHDRQNKVTANGADAPTYDANGSLKKRTASSPSFSYDAWGQMVSYGSIGTGQQETVYLYPFDALHRRIREDYGYLPNQQQATPPKITDLYYNDRWQVVAAEDTPTGTTDSRWRETYVWSVGYVDELVAVDRTDVQGEAPSQRLYVQQDANFNVTSITDANGAIIERYVYSPYGVRAVLDANVNWTADADGKSDVAFSYGHQGGRWDETTGTYHFRMREYDPALGRWLQQDPAGYPDGLSRYQAVLSSPTNSTDSHGLATSVLTSSPASSGTISKAWRNEPQHTRPIVSPSLWTPSGRAGPGSLWCCGRAEAGGTLGVGDKDVSSTWRTTMTDGTVHSGSSLQDLVALVEAINRNPEHFGQIVVFKYYGHAGDDGLYFNDGPDSNTELDNLTITEDRDTGNPELHLNGVMTREAPFTQQFKDAFADDRLVFIDLYGCQTANPARILSELVDNACVVGPYFDIRYVKTLFGNIHWFSGRRMTYLGSGVNMDK